MSDYIFKCWECDFETDDEDQIIYCDDCSHTMCSEHVYTVEYQGFDESLCSVCVRSLKTSIFKRGEIRKG